jgi:hypothetical protein
MYEVPSLLTNQNKVGPKFVEKLERIALLE